MEAIGSPLFEGAPAVNSGDSAFPRPTDKQTEFVRDRPVTGQPAQPVVEQASMCLILTSRLRSMLQKEKRAGKKGKNRKLTKQDVAAVEEELEFLKFDPRKFAREMIEMTRQAMQEPQKAIILPESASASEAQNNNVDLASSTPPETSQ